MTSTDDAILGRIMDLDQKRSAFRRKLQDVKDKYAFLKKELELKEPTIKLLNSLNEKAMEELKNSDEDAQTVSDRFKEEHKEDFEKIHADTNAMELYNALDYEMYKETHAIIKEEEQSKRLEMFKKFGVIETVDN